MIGLCSTPPQGSHERAHLGFEDQPEAPRKGTLGRDLSSRISSAEESCEPAHQRHFLFILSLPFSLCSQGITLSNTRADSPPLYRKGAHPFLGQPHCSAEPCKGLRIVVWLVQVAC